MNQQLDNKSKTIDNLLNMIDIMHINPNKFGKSFYKNLNVRICSQMFVKIGVLKKIAKFKRKDLMVCNFIKKRFQHRNVFSCRCCHIFKDSLFHRTPLVAVSGITRLPRLIQLLKKVFKH